MDFRSFRLALPLSLLAVATAGAQNRLPDSGFEVGSPFPSVAFPSLEDGHPMSLADFRGQKVILHVFASW